MQNLEKLSIFVCKNNNANDPSLLKGDIDDGFDDNVEKKICIVCLNFLLNMYCESYTEGNYNIMVTKIF